MMHRSVFALAGALGLALSAVAVAHPTADEPAAEATETAAAVPTETAASPAVDCTTLEGEAKTTCETAAAAAEKPVAEAKAEEKPEKGGKAKRSNTNRMESVDDDE